jgi:hypothetical protein
LVASDSGWRLKISTTSVRPRIISDVCCLHQPGVRKE